MKTRAYYETLFRDYGDVVDTETIRIMMGGICMNTVLKLIRSGKLQSIYYRGQGYIVPKTWLIDYVLSDHYREYKDKLRVQI